MKTSMRAVLFAGYLAATVPGPAFADEQARGELTIGSILAATPVWVWGLLIVLLYFGLRATQERTLGFFGYVIFPAIMVLLSISALLTLTPYVTTGVAIVVGAVFGVMTAVLLERRFQPTPLGGGRLRLKGEWTNLITVLVIFAVRYATNVIMAVDQPLAAGLRFQVGVGIISTFFGGLLATRIVLRLRTAYGPKSPATGSAART